MHVLGNNAWACLVYKHIFSAVSAGFRFINSCLQENIHYVSGLLSTNDR